MTENTTAQTNRPSEDRTEEQSGNPSQTKKSLYQKIGKYFSIGAIIGIVVGAIGGYLYYHYIGCRSGSCPINSNPYISTLYGALIGYLIGDIFKKKG